MAEFVYRSGGNPPHLPGVYAGTQLVALWPAGVPATLGNIEIAVRLVQARDDETVPVGRDEIRRACRG